MQDEVNEKIHSFVCPDNPDEYRRAKGIYEKISGWNEQTKQKRVQVKQAVKTGKAQEKGRAKEENDRR